MRLQVVIRSLLVAFGIFISVYVTIPDYGHQYSLFRNLAYDPTGWLHEIFYIWAFVLAGMAISCCYETWQRWAGCE